MGTCREVVGVRKSVEPKQGRTPSLDTLTLTGWVRVAPAARVHHTTALPDRDVKPSRTESPQSLLQTVQVVIVPWESRVLQDHPQPIAPPAWRVPWSQLVQVVSQLVQVGTAGPIAGPRARELASIPVAAALPRARSAAGQCAQGQGTWHLAPA